MRGTTFSRGTVNSQRDRAFPDDWAEIARKRRELLKKRALLATAIVTFVVGVHCVLLGLALIIWDIIITAPWNDSTTHFPSTAFGATTRTESHTFAYIREMTYICNDDVCITSTSTT